MKILKKNILTVCLLVLFKLVDLNAQDRIYFRDTILEHAGLKIKFEHGYGNLDYARVKISITNTSDYFVIIHPEDIVAITKVQNTEFGVSNSKSIVVPPKDFLRTMLTFKDLYGMREAVTIHVKQIYFTGSILTTYSPFKVDASVGSWAEFKTLKLEVVAVSPREFDYVVKMKINYSGNNFLTINYNKAVLATEKGNFSNIKKSSAIYKPLIPSQNMSMLFPASGKKGVKIPANVILDGVFSEYSVKSVNGFSVPLQYTSEEEFRKKKEDKVPDEIEEID